MKLFKREDHQGRYANYKFKKVHFIALVIEDIQFKTTVRYSAAVRMVEINILNLIVIFM